MRHSRIRRRRTGANPSHRVTLTLGTTQVADTTWNGLVRQVIAGTVSANLLTTPTTSLKARVSIQAPSTQDIMFLNFWEVEYRRLFRAYGDQLDFQAEVAGQQDFSATDFTSGPVAVWDITFPLQPKRLRDVATTGAGTYTARFRATPDVGDRFWMQGEGSFAAPASIVLRSSTAGLRNPAGGADTVIVRPAFTSLHELLDPAERLADWHRDRGRRTVVLDLQDVYDEFNNGIRHPVAVRQMMAWAAANWTAPAPAYLVLMGDGHLNLKGFAAASPGYRRRRTPSRRT